MSCPACSGDTRVTESRETTAYGGSTRRRRLCSCGHAHTTYEITGAALDALVGRAARPSAAVSAKRSALMTLTNAMHPKGAR